jgi:hypothetical protein
MAITEGFSQETDWSTGYLTAKETQAQLAEVANPKINEPTQVPLDGIAKLKALGEELRRFIRLGKRGGGGGHSIGL